MHIFRVNIVQFNNIIVHNTYLDNYYQFNHTHKHMRKHCYIIVLLTHSHTHTHTYTYLYRLSLITNSTKRKLQINFSRSYHVSKTHTKSVRHMFRNTYDQFFQPMCLIPLLNLFYTNIHTHSNTKIYTYIYKTCYTYSQNGMC